MTAKYENDYAVLQSGYWKVEIDTLHPRVVSMRADASGWGDYSDEMLLEGLGGLSVSQTKSGIFNSRTSEGHKVSACLQKEMVLSMQNIRVGNFAKLDIKLSLAGEKGEVFRIEIERDITQPVELVTDIPFGFHMKRLFSLWSRPDLRFGHNPDTGYQTTYAPVEERRTRRVIGYHTTKEMPEFIIHSAPGYPDFSFKIDKGFYHIEQNYCRYVLVGLSSRNFKDGPIKMPLTNSRWVLEFRLIPQGTLSPVTFKSRNALANRFVREFFDGHVLSAVAVDHEFFGNNPYRSCFAPMAMQFEVKSFMVTDHSHWSMYQGNIEERWRNQIRRTLAHGRINPERVIILFDQGVWQDACGAVTHEFGTPDQNGIFVIGCWWHLLKTGDRNFARSIKSDMEALLRPLIRLQSKEYDGLLVNPLPGIPSTPASGYNDCLSVGHMDTNLNVIAFDAFRKFAGLLEFLDEPEEAVEYRQRADQIMKAVNRYLWNERGGRYVGWIDITGKTHDFWFTDTNFYAFSAGLVPQDRATKMLTSFLSHPNHHLLFAAGVNLTPITDGTLVAPIRFGECIHGTLYLGPMAEEMVFRARSGGADCAWEMLGNMMNQWEKDRLYREPLFQDWACHHPYIFEWWQKYTGKASYSWLGNKGPRGAATEPYLSDGGSMLWALYTGVIGIRPDFQGITFSPHIPKAIADVKVKIRLMGRSLVLRTTGYGDTLTTLILNGKKIAGDKIEWSSMPDESIIDMILSNDKHSFAKPKTRRVSEKRRKTSKSF